MQQRAFKSGAVIALMLTNAMTARVSPCSAKQVELVLQPYEVICSGTTSKYTQVQ